jgi:tetratricopeptide (TPR) repeat protein
MMALAALAMLLAAQAAQQNTPPPEKTSKPMGTFDEPPSGSPQPFHSVGVRGTIDAGGYGASATEKTLTEFFEQLTDLQVALLRTAWAPQNPCAASNSARQKAIDLLSRGDFAAAANVLEQLLPTNAQPSTRQLLGLAYEGLGQCVAAAEQFGAAASLTSPDDADLFAQSVALLLEGAVDRAETVTRRALEHDADPASLNRLSLGAVLFQRGEIPKALNLFLDAASARASDHAPFEFIAIAVRSADSASLTHAISVLGTLTQHSPENASAHYALACALSAGGGVRDNAQTTAIETELKRAVTLDPHLADAHFRLGALYAGREDLSPAIDEYVSALACNPRLVEAHYRLSQLYTRRGELQLAKEQRELHQQLRAQQKSDLQNGRVAVQIPEVSIVHCPGSGIGRENE